MMRKLYSLVAGDCCADNPDSPQHQEMLLGGHLFNMTMKEKMSDYLAGIKAQIVVELNKNSALVDFNDRRFFAKVAMKVNCDIGKKMEVKRINHYPFNSKSTF